ncbi:MAG: hypothetical protein ACRDK2_16500 [Solirubrobacteraceae bacterium]
MTESPTKTSSRSQWLPAWARPLEHERSGRGELRLIETTILVLAGILLAVATVNDVVLQTHTNHRLVADLRTWRTLTGHDYKNVGTEQDVKNFTTRDVTCGNASPGAPESVTRVCLIMTGPVHHGLRAVHGGYYLPPYLQDLAKNRYGCFGTATSEQLCKMQTPPGAAHPALEGG